jgi:hypothetical protein
VWEGGNVKSYKTDQYVVFKNTDVKDAYTPGHGTEPLIS